MSSQIVEIADVVQKYCYLTDPDPAFNQLVQFFTSDAVTSDVEWVFLPVQPENEDLIFYSFFKTDKALRFFNELAKASLGGPFISQIRVGVCVPNHLNALVAQMSSLGYFRFQEVRLDRHSPFLLGRLTRLQTVINRSIDSLQPTGVLALTDIRKFRQHLTNSECDAAQVILNQIGSSGRLSSVNFLFLELQLKQKMGRNAEIWNHPSINEFVVTARPRAVTELLLESLWNYLRHSLGSGEVASIDDLQIQRMAKLLAGIKTPQSAAGRVCLAIVIAVSAPGSSLSDYEIPVEEISVLQELIDNKRIPVSLLPSNTLITAVDAVHDFSKIGPNEFNEVRQELVDDGNARGLFALLAHAGSVGVNPESTLKNIVSVVESEFLVELASDTVFEVNGRMAQTSNWTSNLQKKWDKVQFMARLFEGGFTNLKNSLNSIISDSDLVFQIRTLEECVQTWSLECFQSIDVDKDFSEAILNSGNNVILKSALTDLLSRLVEAGTGTKTQKAIEEILI